MEQKINFFCLLRISITYKHFIDSEMRVSFVFNCNADLYINQKYILLNKPNILLHKSFAIRNGFVNHYIISYNPRNEPRVDESYVLLRRD